MHRAAGNVQVRRLLVEESRQQAHQPALRLPLLAEEKQVVLGDQSEVDLGNDRAVVADDAGKEVFARGEHADEIVVDFAFNGLRSASRFREVLAVCSV